MDLPPEHSPIDSGGIRLGDFARIGIDEAADRHGIAGHRGDGVAGNRDPAKLRTQADGIRNRVEPAREGRTIDRSPAEREGQRRKILGARWRIVSHHFPRETAGDDAMGNVKPSSQGQS